MHKNSLAAAPQYHRSVNRCHLISRIPIYDLNGVTRMYFLEFTAGNLLQCGSLEPKHVPHILHGFFIRRSIASFVGRNHSVMLALPLCRDLLTLKDKYPSGRLVVYVRKEQPVTEDTHYLLTALRRCNVRFACDASALLQEGGWQDFASSFDFAVTWLQDADYTPCLTRFVDVKKSLNPRLKLITAGVTQLKLRQEVLQSGTDYVQSIFVHPHNYYRDKTQLLRNADVFALLKMVHAAEVDLNTVDTLVRRHPYMQRDVYNLLQHCHPSFREYGWNLNKIVPQFGVNVLRDVLAVAALHGLLAISAQGSDKFSQNAAFEPVKTALLRARFLFLLSRDLSLSESLHRTAFTYGLFSIERLWAAELNPKLEQTLLNFSFKLQDEVLLERLLDVIRGLEQLNLNAFVKALLQLHGDVGVALHDYEHALMWSNEVAAILYSTNYSDLVVTRSQNKLQY